MKDVLKKAREWVWLEGDPEKDRSVALVFAGVLEIVLGILSFSLAMLLMVVLSSTGLGAMKPGHLWVVMAFMFYLTGWFIVMGMGSMKARRWARVLVLVGAWVTLFFGTLLMAMLLYILPEMHNLLTDSGLLNPDAALVMLYSWTSIMLLLQVVFPLFAIVFYSMKGVETTCERLNPDPCWTDRIPLPLMAMGFVSALGTLSIVMAAPTHYVVFLFGRVVDGGAGLTIVLLISLACCYVGWGAFTRKMHAWWGAYALVLITSSSMMLTFSEMDMDVLYARMGYSAGQIAQLGEYHVFNPAMLTFVSCVWGAMACIYLVWVRDCFCPEEDKSEIKSYAQIQSEEAQNQPDEGRVQGPRMRLDD
ncbi:MAG: hypothetical protein HKP10_01605 [Kiritimatiellales bacterium]|nr:hypothetical protein [Kiritimatiellales bacterium]